MKSLTLFAALMVTQAVHSVEEYLGKLYESFPPAAFVSGLFSSNLERGFIIGNILLLAAGFWCVAGPARLGWKSAPTLAWIWVAIEVMNGLGHPLWSLRQGGYTPGVATAPLLLVLALLLARELRRGGLLRRSS